METKSPKFVGDDFAAPVPGSRREREKKTQANKRPIKKNKQHNQKSQKRERDEKKEHKNPKKKTGIIKKHRTVGREELHPVAPQFFFAIKSFLRFFCDKVFAIILYRSFFSFSTGLFSRSLQTVSRVYRPFSRCLQTFLVFTDRFLVPTHRFIVSTDLFSSLQTISSCLQTVLSCLQIFSRCLQTVFSCLQTFPRLYRSQNLFLVLLQTVFSFFCR